MDNYAISVSSLNIEIDGRLIVDSFSFNGEIGENITIIGPNGAGKTTLLKALCGFLPFSGDVFFKGVSIKNITPYERALKVSFVSQHSQIDGDFTVGSFLELSRYPYKKPWERLNRSDRNAINNAMELTQCKEFFLRKISTLSGGERQKVFIAAAIAQDTPVILFDEPLTHLDPVQRINISKLISEISKIDNKTVITVTHEINEAVQFSSRAIIINNGRKEFDGSPVFAGFKKTLDKVFLTEFISIKEGEDKRPFLFPGEKI